MGPEENQYSMPMSLIFHYSAIAERYLNAGFAESAGNIVILPDYDPEAFGQLYSYITEGRLRVLDNCCKKDDDCSTACLPSDNNRIGSRPFAVPFLSSHRLPRHSLLRTDSRRYLGRVRGAREVLDEIECVYARNCFGDLSAYG